jgi:thioredoxin-like negative regulator of GroEL
MSVYHFWSFSCIPCQALKPVIQDLQEEFPTLNWMSVNIHADPDGLAKRFGVQTVPTIVAVSRSGTIERHSGTQAAGYYRILRNALRQ